MFNKRDFFLSKKTVLWNWKFDVLAEFYLELYLIPLINIMLLQLQYDFTIKLRKFG